MVVIKVNLSKQSASGIIAGEMLNIEHSVKHFIDGVARVCNGAPDDYVGYPRVNCGDNYARVAAACGTIYLPSVIINNNDALSQFVETLEKSLHGMERTMVRLDGKSLCKPHSVIAFQHTNIRYEGYWVRYFTTYHKSSANSGLNTFTWILQTYDNYFTKHKSTIRNTYASIFVDCDDLVNVPTMRWEQPIEIKDLHGFNLFVPMDTIVISNINPDEPLMTEFLHHRSAGSFYESINCVERELSDFYEDFGILGRYTCNRCKCTIFGEGYVISDIEKYTVCARCAQGNMTFESVRYRTYFKVRFPTKCLDLVAEKYGTETVEYQMRKTILECPRRFVKFDQLELILITDTDGGVIVGTYSVPQFLMARVSSYIPDIKKIIPVIFN